MAAPDHRRGDATRFFSTVTEQLEALIAGTPEQQMQAHRERQAAAHAHAIISTK